MEKELINLSVTKDELSVIFDCLIGSASCPPSHSALVNKVFNLKREFNTPNSNVYCK